MKKNNDFKKLFFFVALIAFLTAVFLLTTASAQATEIDDPSNPEIPGPDNNDETGCNEQIGNSYTATIIIDTGTNFDIYAWYNQDVTGTFTWNPEYIPVCDVINVKVEVRAWDVDNPLDQESKEIDKVYLNGQYLGDLEGSNNNWSWTTFNLNEDQINTIFGSDCFTDPVTLTTFIDVDSNNECAVWAVEVDKVKITIIYETDDTPPIISTNIPPSPGPNECIDDDFTIRATVNDPYCSCGIKEVKVEFYELETCTFEYEKILTDIGCSTWEAAIPFNVFDGCKYKYQIIAEDNMGNIGYGSEIGPIFFDNTPPTTTKTYGSPFYNNGTVNFITSQTPITLDSIDDCSGVERIKYRIDSIPWQIVMDDSATFLMQDHGKGEGQHTIEYHAIDNCGNYEQIKCQTVCVDDTPPIISKTHPDPCYFEVDECSSMIKVDSDIVLHAVDQGTPPCLSGVENIYYGFTYEGTWHPMDPFDSYCGNSEITMFKYGKWWYTYNKPIEFHEECKHILEYWAQDNLGNEGIPNTQTYYVNKCQDEVWIDDDFNANTPGWLHTHFSEKQLALDWLKSTGTAYVYDGLYDEDIVIDDGPCCDNFGITQMGAYGCFPIGLSAVIDGTETIKVDNVMIKYLEYTPNSNGAIIVDPCVCGTIIRCNKFNKECLDDAVGVKSYSSYEVNAELNWWGAPNGPKGGKMDDGEQADGLGVKVIGNVDVEPWIGIHAEIKKPTEEIITVKIGEPVTFDASDSWAYTYGECCQNAEALPMQYLWDFKDGRYSSDKINTHIFEEPGINEVSLMVDSPGIPGLYPNFMYDWDYVTVNVTEETMPLNANADGEGLGRYEAEIDEEISFNGIAIGGNPPYTYDWAFGDGTYSNKQNPSHSYTKKGTYIASFTVHDSKGATDTDTVSVVVTEHIEDLFASIEALTEGYVNDNIDFESIVSGGTDPYTYEWDFGDGKTSTEANPSHKYENSGKYTVTLTVTDNKEKSTLAETIINIIKDMTTDPKINMVRGGFGIVAKIESGDNACCWDISIDGEHVFYSGHKNGSINANMKKTVRLGFSFATGKVDVWVKAGTVEKCYNAFAIGPFYLFVREN